MAQNKKRFGEMEARGAGGENKKDPEPNGWPGLIRDP
jgi:hypothetical protein